MEAEGIEPSSRDNMNNGIYPSQFAAPYLLPAADFQPKLLPPSEK